MDLCLYLSFILRFLEEVSGDVESGVEEIAYGMHN